MKMLNLKTAEEIELIRESALIVSKTLGMLATEVQPGVTTLHLDALAETFIRDHGAEPGFLGLYDFPNTLCMSPNEQVVHGIPNDTPLKEGDTMNNLFIWAHAKCVWKIIKSQKTRFGPMISYERFCQCIEV